MIVEWTPHAEAALLDSVAYIVERNPRAAVTFMRAVIAKTGSLARFPHLGRPGFHPATRELRVHRNYVVVYRIHGHRVEIVQFWHAAQRRDSLP